MRFVEGKKFLQKDFDALEQVWEHDSYDGQNYTWCGIKWNKDAGLIKHYVHHQSRLQSDTNNYFASFESFRDYLTGWYGEDWRNHDWGKIDESDALAVEFFEKLYEK